MVFRAVAMSAVAAAMLASAGCSIFGSGTSQSSRASSADLGPEETGGIAVNSYLWRATLDTLKFLPLTSADPYGGVVITDWYSNPENPQERVKATVYILDTRLRADGVSASVFREQYLNGAWQTVSTNPDTNVALENAILSRARDLRLSAIDQ